MHYPNGIHTIWRSKIPDLFLPTKIREQILLKRKWINFYLNEDFLIKMKIFKENW
jgi:hypothetical protein